MTTKIAAPAKDIFSHRQYWTARFGTVPYLPMSRAELAAPGWDACDVTIVSGDAHVDESVMKSRAFTDQTVKITCSHAIVTNTHGGNTNNTKIGVLMVWAK